MSHGLRLCLIRLVLLCIVAALLATPALTQDGPTAQTMPKQEEAPPAKPMTQSGPESSAPQSPQPVIPPAVHDATAIVPVAPVTPEAQALSQPEIVWTQVRPAKPEAPKDELTVAAVGDIMLGSMFPDKTGGSLAPEDGIHLLEEVAPFIQAADISIGNLEGPLYDGTEPSLKCAHKAEGTCYAFKVPTRYAKLLADAGFVAMGVANNHAKDFGAAGQESTIKALSDTGIAQSGGVGVVAHLMIKGKKVSYIAFATYPQFNNALDIEASTALVQSETRLADYVIVSFHGGAEGASKQHVPEGHEMFLGEDRGDLRTFTHAMIDAGAAFVFGHGPHVVRGMEMYKGHLIAYSLGNFATYGHINVQGVNGLTLVLSVRLDKDGRCLGGKIYSVYQEYPGGPRVDPKAQVLGVIRALSQNDFEKTAVKLGEDGSIDVPTSPVETAPVQEKPAVAPVAQN